MRKIFTKFLLLFLLVAGSVTQSKADHMVGSDIYWKCLGGDSFSITIVDYRDCNGIAFVNSPFILTAINCPSISPVTVSGSSSGGKDITPVCKKSCDRCTDKMCDFAYGIQQYFITATVILPSTCCDFQISWTQCCRSAGITTGATWANYYITSQMSRCTMGYCDNSPYFTDPPVAVYCTNQCVVYNPGANDVDRDPNTGAPDSLSYALTAPLTADGSPTPWSGSYSYKQPLDYSGFPNDPDGVWNPPSTCNGFHVDSITGEIDFKAVKADVTVIALAVSEYRKDSLGIYEKIGEIRRDMQIIIIDCPANHPPIITGINGGTTSSIKMCADKQTCFTIKAFDLDPLDTDRMTWNNPGTMDGASFYVRPDGKKWPTAEFCWSPTDKDVRSYPYTFVVTAVDNACPVPGRSDRAFSVYVVASPKANYSATVQNCGVVNFSATVAAESTTGIVEYVWSGQGSPGYGPLFIVGRTGSYKYTKPGTYDYTLAVTGPNGCVRNYVDSVKIPPYVQISLPPDTTVCQGSSPITINATIKDSKQPYSVTWDHSNYTGLTMTSKIVKDTVFVVHIKDATGCTNYDSMRVFMQPLPQPVPGPDQRGCWGHTVKLTSGLKKHMPYASWTWINGGDTVRNFLHGDSIYVSDSGKYALMVRDSFGCPGYDTANVYFNPLVKANNGSMGVCAGSSLKIRAGVGGLGANYKWIDQVHNRVIGTDSTYTITNAQAPTYSFKIIITQSRYGVTCADTGIVNVTTHPIPTPTVKPFFPPMCIEDPPLEISTIPPPKGPMVDAAHRGGTWYYPQNAKGVVNGFIFPTQIGITDNDTPKGTIYYIYMDQFGCTSKDSAYIDISPKPQVTAGPDTEICTANGKYMLSAYSGPLPGVWNPLQFTNNKYPGVFSTPSAAIVHSGTDVYFDPSAVTTDTVYGVIYTHTETPAAGKSTCSNSDTVYIRVRTNPAIKLTQVDSQCNNAGAIQLSSYSSPPGGIWTIHDVKNVVTLPRALSFDKVTNSYYFYPDSTGGGYHQLLYTAYADPGRKMCSNVDSMSIYVAQQPSPIDFTVGTGATGTWTYCASSGPVLIHPDPVSGVGVGQPVFSAAIGNSVYQTGSNWYFDPSKADSTDSTKNVITYYLHYNFGKCIASVSHLVRVDGRPTVRMLPTPQACVGPTKYEYKAIATNAKMPLSWSSSDPNNHNFQYVGGLSTDVLFTPTNAQINSHQFDIYVTATNTAACPSAHAKDSVNIYFPPNISFTSNQVGCEPFGVQFNASAVVPPSNTNGKSIKSYDWDFGDGSPHASVENPKHVYNVQNGQSSQQYNVKFTAVSDSGCTADTTNPNWITVNASPRPAITANPQITTIALPQIQFDVNEPMSKGIDFTDPKTTYHWNFGDSGKVYATIKNPLYTYNDTGKFKVVVRVNSKGCTGDSSLVVYIQPELIIYIPNAFTPGGMHGNGKGHEPNYFSENVNQTFQPVISAYSTFEMSIYNRWGELMYTTTNPEKGWDGRYEGRRPQEDVYVYVIKATGYSGKGYTFTGSITLLR